MLDSTAASYSGNADHGYRINGRHRPRNLQEEMIAAVEYAKEAKMRHARIHQWLLRYYQAMESSMPEIEADFAAVPWEPARFGCATMKRWHELKRLMLADLERRNIKGFRFTDV